MFPHGEWVDDIFFPLFQAYLREALNKEVTIFKDSKEIQNGNDWRLSVRKALIHSKVMVSIFSPAYFRSEWCIREFATIDHRQRKLGFLSVENPTGLIVPLRLFDGEHFPDYANSLQMLNCVDFNRIGGGVKQTNLYIELQGKLQEWAYDVAAAIERSPEWNSEWTSEDWVERPFDSLTVKQLPNSINPPSL